MTKQEIEALVLSVTDRVLKGMKVEDSLIECKGEWPEPTKARQLAAHANSAHGEQIVWIIGLDEKSGRLTSPASPEMANWWSKMASRFDDNIVPGMTDLIVPVNEEASVTALVFSTDRAPYVVKVSDGEGRVEREIPIREGTRTRSAYRHELIRLLQPASVPPPISLIDATLSGSSTTTAKRIVVVNQLNFELAASIYVEQRMDRTIMIPYHLMKYRVEFIDPSDAAGRSIALEPHKPRSARVNISESKYGVFERMDGVAVAGSAVVELRASYEKFPERFDDYSRVHLAKVSIELGIAGSTRSILITEELHGWHNRESGGMAPNSYRWTSVR